MLCDPLFTISTLFWIACHVIHDMCSACDMFSPRDIYCLDCGLCWWSHAEDNAVVLSYKVGITHWWRHRFRDTLIVVQIDAQPMFSHIGVNYWQRSCCRYGKEVVLHLWIYAVTTKLEVYAFVLITMICNTCYSNVQALTLDSTLFCHSDFRRRGRRLCGNMAITFTYQARFGTALPVSSC